MRTKLVGLETAEWDKDRLRQQIAETTWGTGFFVPKVEFKIFLGIVKDIIKNECTPIQQQYFNEYYFCEKSMKDISKDFGVEPSTVARTIYRAERKICNYMKYFKPFVDALNRHNIKLESEE